MKQKQISCILDTVFFSMVKVEFNKLSEENKGMFLSVTAVDLFDQSEVDVEKKYVLTEAIECYHCNRSWIR